MCVQDKIELKAEGHDAEFISIAEQQAFEEIRLRIRQLPKASYMAEVCWRRLIDICTHVFVQRVCLVESKIVFVFIRPHIACPWI